MDCSDWISNQRILFYTKEENGESTRCIETQRFEEFDDSFKMFIQVNPENPLGQIFKIESTISGKGDALLFFLSFLNAFFKRVWKCNRC